MAAIVFPDSPSTDSVVFVNGRYWIWSSETWEPFNPVLGRGVITGGTITGGSSTVLPTTFQVTEVTPEADDWSNKRVNLVAKSGATGAAKIPAGTTAQRDATPTVGDLRVNTTTGRFEGYVSDWNGLAQPSNLLLETRVGNTQLVSTDIGKSIDVTVGDFTQTFDTPSNLGEGWWCYYKNSSTGDIGFTTTLQSTIFPEGTVDVISDNILPDPGFDNPALWTAQSGWLITGGSAKATTTTSGCISLKPGVLYGHFYKVVWSPVITSGSVSVICGGVAGTTRSASGTYTEYMTSTSSSFYLDAISSLTALIPEIAVYQLEGWEGPSTVTWNGSQFTLSNYSNTISTLALQSPISLSAGQTYEITYTITRSAGSIALVVGSTVLTTRSASGTYTDTVSPTAAESLLWFKQISSNFSGTVSEISIKAFVAAVDADLGLNWYMYSGEERLIYSTGSKLKSKVTAGFTKTITSSGVYVDPPGYKTKTLILLGAGGGGAGGDSTVTDGGAPAGGAGGGGGGVTVLTLPEADLSGYVTVGVGGAGGAGGVTGAGASGSLGGSTSLAITSTTIISTGGTGATTSAAGTGGVGYSGVTGGTGGTTASWNSATAAAAHMCPGGSGGGGASYDTSTPSYNISSAPRATRGLYGIGGAGGAAYSGTVAGSVASTPADATYGCGGGGGGGCGSPGTATGGAGGKGGDGLVIIVGSI